MNAISEEERIKEAVRQAYGGLARRFSEEPTPAPARMSCCGPESDVKVVRDGSCCGSSQPAEPAEPSNVAQLYSESELNGLPETVTDASAGCGNPIAIASLHPGEVVLDLGAGGGIDCFLAARQVGPEGRVIGLDMTPDMIKLARRNAKKVGATNVDFRYGEIEEIPLPDASVDVILSNCVINLSTDKDAVFAEAYRVLRPGGRMSISDIVIDGTLPPIIRQSLDAWAGCLAGALDERVYLDKIRLAGFDEVEVASRNYVEISQAADSETARALLEQANLSARDLDHKVASIRVTAVKSA
jgi:arsenite methyltransferase